MNANLDMALVDWLEANDQDLESCYPEDDWNALQLAAALGNVDCVSYLLGKDVSPDGGTALSSVQAVPRLTPLHIAAKMNHIT